MLSYIHLDTNTFRLVDKALILDKFYHIIKLEIRVNRNAYVSLLSYMRIYSNDHVIEICISETYVYIFELVPLAP